MKIALLFATLSVINAAVIPGDTPLTYPSSDARAIGSVIDTRSFTFNDEHIRLAKRRGGGGFGGGGARGSSGSSGSSSGSSGSTGSSGSGSSSGSKSGGSSGGSGSTGSAGSTSAGRPAYGGGSYYGGGSRSAYRSGTRTPSGLLPFALIGGAVAAAAIFPGLWLYGAYEYNYDHRYSFNNQSNATTEVRKRDNTSLPVTCLCQQYSACGCDDVTNADGSSAVLDDLVGNGSYAALNKSLINVADVNNTRTIVLNGTLPNGTEDSSSSTSDMAPTSDARTITPTWLMESSGLWALISLVCYTLWI